MDKGVAFFYPKKRDKKQIEVLIDPFEVGLSQSAGRANPGILIECLGFRRYAADDEHTCCELRVPGYEL